MDPARIGENIRDRRVAKALTQDQLAEMLGVSRNTVSRWERGVNIPDLSLLVQLSRALDVSIDRLITGQDYPESVISQIPSVEESDADESSRFSRARLIMISLLSCLIIVLTDLIYGFFRTKLYWDIHDRAFKPFGLIYSLIFGNAETISFEGKELIRMFGFLLVFLFLFIVILIVFISLSKHRDIITTKDKKSKGGRS